MGKGLTIVGLAAVLVGGMLTGHEAVALLGVLFLGIFALALGA